MRTMIRWCLSSASTSRHKNTGQSSEVKVSFGVDTMDCTDIKAVLSGLVDDELDRETRHQAERHLATCQACRSLVSEAEGLNALIATHAQMLTPPGSGLPDGFEAAVLTRTVYAQSLRIDRRRWTNWTGWLAAAAVLGLSAMIFVLDQRAGDRIGDSNQTQVPAIGLNPYLTGAQNRSMTFDGDVTASLASHIKATSGASTVLRDAMLRPTISRDDAETLYAASQLMDMLEQANLSTFADVDRIRRVAEYDDLLPRLAAARANVQESDRPALLAAESLLLRIVRGPVDMDDLHLMRDTVARLDLSRQLGSLSDNPTTPSSL